MLLYLDLSPAIICIYRYICATNGDAGAGNVGVGDFGDFCDFVDFGVFGLTSGESMTGHAACICRRLPYQHMGLLIYA